MSQEIKRIPGIEADRYTFYEPYSFMVPKPVWVDIANTDTEYIEIQGWKKESEEHEA